MVLPVSLSSASSFSWLLKLLPSHTCSLGRKFSPSRGRRSHAKEIYKGIPNWRQALKHFSSKQFRDPPPPPPATTTTKKDLRAQETAVRQSEESPIRNESAVLRSAWPHSHSAWNKSEPQRAPCPCSATSTKLPPPQIGGSLQPWGLARAKTLAETTHTNLKTHSVTDTLLTREVGARLEQLSQWAGDWRKAY